MFLLNLSSNLKGIVWNHSRMRVDKNLLLNIFKERCSIYFYLERFCFSLDRLFRVSPSLLSFFSRKVSAKIKHFFQTSKFFEKKFFRKLFQNLSLWVVFLSQSGCKDKGICSNYPNIFHSFFTLFSPNRHTWLNINILHRKLFQVQNLPPLHPARK